MMVRAQALWPIHLCIPSQPNMTSCTQWELNKLPKVIIKHCTLTFQATTERDRAGLGEEMRKERELMWPARGLSLGAEGSEFQPTHNENTRLDSSVIPQSYWHSSLFLSLYNNKHVLNNSSFPCFHPYFVIKKYFLKICSVVELEGKSVIFLSLGKRNLSLWLRI